MLKFNRNVKWKNRLSFLKNYRFNPEAFMRIQIDKSLKKEFYRKSIHLSSLWIPLVIYFMHPGFSVSLFALLLLGDIGLEYANYKRYPWARQIFGALFAKTLRNKETVHARFQATGSMYVLAAAILCTILFSRSVAVIALSVMLVSDTAAALFGKAYGSRKLYKNKSLEGTTAFFMSALLVNMVLSPIFPFNVASVIACLAATFAEMFEDKLDIDDNFSITLVVGALLTFLNL